MIWRECQDSDREAFLRLTREPMGGKVQLVWGLDELRCPPECENLRAYVIETSAGIVGCSMAWDWPGGHRYLSGLRLSREMKSRPRPKFTKAAFEAALTGVDHGWTSIGAGNERARGVLERDVSWMPCYTPRQAISTWFVPLPRSQAEGARDENNALEITPFDWRHIAVASGSGMAYRAGRILNMLGRPGIAKPGQRMRIGGFRPSLDSTPNEIRKQLSEVRGFDGLVVVLPTDSDLVKHWHKAMPRLTWEWQSTLYSISWRRDAALPTIPEWKGFWL